MHVDHTQNIIEVRNVSFSYENEEVLKDITLDVHKGDYLGLIGPNGGGKTTLLKIILGILAPTRGTVHLFGHDICCFKDWSKIGYVPQKVTHFDVNFPITVKEVVQMGRIAKRGFFQSFNKKDDELVRRSLEHVSMWQYRDKIIGDLSGGQQQRIFIARALASEPEVILLDEPTVGVDVKTQQQFYELLKVLNRELSLTLVLASHDINVIAHETTEIACINKALIYDSNPTNFMKNNDIQKLYGDKVKFILHSH